MGEENPQRRLIGTLDSAKDWLRQKQQKTQSAKPETTHAPESSGEDAEEELSEDDLIEDGDDLTDIDEVEIPIDNKN